MGKRKLPFWILVVGEGGALRSFRDVLEVGELVGSKFWVCLTIPKGSIAVWHS